MSQLELIYKSYGPKHMEVVVPAVVAEQAKEVVSEYGAEEVL